jgi:hypothetical protein
VTALASGVLRMANAPDPPDDSLKSTIRGAIRAVAGALAAYNTRDKVTDLSRW